MPLKDVTPEHFARWLELFRATCGELCTDAQALAFIDKAERIAKSFQLAMFYDPAVDRR
jgi:hemoglobin